MSIGEVRRIAALVAVLLSLATGLAKAQTGFVVLQPIEGRAQVFVDGQASGWLSSSELNLRVPAGRRVIVVRREGYMEFSRTVTVRVDDVVPLTVVFQASRVQVIREDEAGASRQQLVPVRIASLEPAIVPVEGAGISSRTPVLLALPVGSTNLRVGDTQLCIQVGLLAAGDTALIRLRAGAIDVTRSVRLCTGGADNQGAGLGLARTGTPRLGTGLALDQFSQIPTGTFQMGSTAEQPVHSVTISRTFYMQKTEVTQGQWRAVMGSNPSYFATCGDTCPVERVNWDDITTFLQRLNAQTPGVTYRLPTEAEWEYAARAGTTGETYGTLDAIAWYNGNSASSTHAAAGKQANAWGLYDMIGNVWEWVNDWYGSYSSASVTDPTGPATGTYRVLRGGSWYGSFSARAATRLDYDPSGRDYGVGVRLVRTP